ncbi:MAG TPA: MBL fold metallo-hydrolase [Candidatus Saccharimonadales bacterium]|nr:MBL fold metallo-hydrolase [Candidatus Saccharimonadales bacterium]
MDMQFYGANCVVLTGKQIRLVFDDNLASLGGKSVSKNGDICLFTGPHGPVGVEAKLVLDTPGEYEASGVSIFGIQARSHMDEEGKKTAVMYKVTWGETKALVTGHVFPKLSDDQLEAIGIVDVMFVPVGGNGYTLDATGALQVIKAVEPKIVIPTHYGEKGLEFEVPQAELSDALHTMAMEPKERVAKFQFKPAEVTDTTQLVVLETTK